MCYTVYRRNQGNKWGSIMGIHIEVRKPGEGNVDDKIKEYKKKVRIQNMITVCLIMAMLLSTYLLVEVQTYGNMHKMQEYGDVGTDNSNYAKYSDGIIKYSRDGVAYLDKKGEEKWNQSYQLQNPFINTNDDALVIGNQGGNDLYVFNEKGLLGEIHTNYPIEDAVVAENGIVSVLLKNGMTPQIICYDAAGNILIEHMAALTGIGYPIGMALSPEGTMLQVSYYCVEEGVGATRVVYYDFKDGDTDKESYQVAEDIYKNVVIPESFFVNSRKSVLIGDSSFMIYEGKEQPTLIKTVEIEKRIQSVFYDKNYIGFVLKNAGEEKAELRLYNMNGEQKMSKTFIGEYSNISISDGNVLMFDGGKCAIFSSLGVQKFEGEVEMNIKEILPLTGINMYLLISNDGMEEVRLVK